MRAVLAVATALAAGFLVAPAPVSATSSSGSAVSDASLRVQHPVAARIRRASPPVTLDIRLTRTHREVAPVGTAAGAARGDVVVDRGRAKVIGVADSHGRFIRRGVVVVPRPDARDSQATTDMIQVDLPGGALLFQASGYWDGIDAAALLGGTLSYAGVRGSAEVSHHATYDVWHVTVLPAAGVDMSKATSQTFARELVAQERVTIGKDGDARGNLGFTQGRLLGADGSLWADYTSFSTVVQDLPNDKERRWVQATFDSTDGSIFVNGMIVADANAIPTSPQQYAISGGTGSFAGARGYAQFLPGATPRWRFTTYADKDSARPIGLTSAAQHQTDRIEVETDGVPGASVCDFILANGRIRQDGRTGHFAFLGQAVQVPADASSRTQMSFHEYRWNGRRLFVAGLITLSADHRTSSAPRVVIGGLGSWTGANGQAILRMRGTWVWRLLVDALH